MNSNGEKDKKIKNSVASKSVIATENWQPGPISFFSGLSLEQSQAMKNDMPSTPRISPDDNHLNEGVR